MTPLKLDREEAREALIALNKRRVALVDLIHRVQRKRSWRPSERAMEAGKLQQQLNALTKLYDAVAEAYELGGF